MATFQKIHESQKWTEDINCQYDIPLETNISIAKTKNTILMWVILNLDEYHILDIIRTYDDQIECNLTNSYGWTILHYACFQSYYKVVKKILSRQFKAEINSTDYFGWPPLYLATYRYTRINKRLQKYKKRLKEPDKTESKEKQQECKSKLLIVRELFKSCKKIIKLLVCSGANLNLCLKKSCKTPIMFLCEHQIQDDYEILKLFLEYGARLDLRNDKNMTPCMIALTKYNIYKDINIIKILLDAGGYQTDDSSGEYMSLPIMSTDLNINKRQTIELTGQLPAISDSSSEYYGAIPKPPAPIPKPLPPKPKPPTPRSLPPPPTPKPPTPRPLPPKPIIDDRTGYHSNTHYVMLEMKISEEEKFKPLW